MRPIFPLFSVVLLAVSAAGSARAETRDPGTQVEITPASIGAGQRFSWIQCPCFRLKTEKRIGGFSVETQSFLISSDSLFQLSEETLMDFERYAVRTKRLGAVEALWKGGHVGLGFTGGTWGKDRDRGYSDWVHTGLYALANLVRTDALRLDIRSGYDFETMRVNLGPQIESHRIDQSAVLRWRTKRWSGRAITHVSFDPESIAAAAGAETLSWGVETGVKLRVFDFHGVQLGVEADLSFERDGFRRSLELEPDLVSETMMMTLSYVQGRRPGP